MNTEKNSEIQLLREYLRIPTVHPDINFRPILSLLQAQAEELNLQFNVAHITNSGPIIILIWSGSRPELEAIMLNSHMDVAPVNEEKWTYSPFSAHMDENGMIYGRGTQNSKSIGIQYLAAIRALKRDGFQGRRTIYLTFMPDEENRGRGGMKSFVTGEFFRDMNVGFALDVGDPSPNNNFIVSNAERIICQVGFEIAGKIGGDVPRGTAGEKLNFILKKLQTVHDAEVKRLRENKDLSLGDITTINLTKCNSSEGTKELPWKIEAVFDMRFSGKIDPEQFINQVRSWTKEAGGAIEIFSIDADFISTTTPINDGNKYWKAFRKIFQIENLKVTPTKLRGSSDSRFLRNMNIPALNFSPIRNTPNLIRGDNEHLSAETFLEGVRIYKKLISALVNVP